MTAELGILAAFFVCVMGLVTGAGYLWMKRWDASAGLALAGAEPESARAYLTHIFQIVGQAIPTSDREATAVRKRLIAAGYRNPAAVSMLYGLKCAAALFLGAALWWIAVAIQEDASAAWFPAMGGLFYGYIAPDRILRILIRKRAERLRLALPDALDLMVLCVEAGQSLDQAIVDTAVEMKRSYKDLSDELTLAHLELRAGKSRAEALRHLAERTGEPELRKLANLLIQSDRFGTSLGPALRVHARYLRLHIKQKAQESARKVGIKLLFPIFFLILPSLLMVTAGPALLQIFTQLLPMLSGE